MKKDKSCFDFKHGKPFDTDEVLQTLEGQKKTAFYTFMRGKKVSVGVQVLTPHQRYGEADHDHHEVYYVVEGEGTFQLGKGVNKRVFEVYPGKIFRCPSGIYHEFKASKTIVIVFIFQGIDE